MTTDDAFVTAVLIGTVIIQSLFILTIGLVWLYTGEC